MCHVSPPALNQRGGWRTRSFCGCLRCDSVTPTALLLKKKTKVDSRVLRAERLCLLVYLGKMRPISGLEAVFQFLFLISSLKHRLSAFIHKHKERACLQRGRMRSPEYSSVNTHANTHAHTRGSLRCWQHSGTPPLFIWLLGKKKKGRKHSGAYLNFLTRRPADRLISHWVSDVCLPRVSPSEGGGRVG